MPKIGSPEPLRSGKVSSSDVRDHVAWEGLGFCVYEFIPADRLADERLAELWRGARAAMQRIVEYLETVARPRRLKERRKVPTVPPVKVTVGRVIDKRPERIHSA